MRRGIETASICACGTGTTVGTARLASAGGQGETRGKKEDVGGEQGQGTARISDLGEGLECDSGS